MTVAPAPPAPPERPGPPAQPEPTIEPATAPPDAKMGSARRETHRVTRWLRTYLSMISLLLVLFFGATGVTLNHPSWTLGMNGSRHTVSGTLPAGFETNGTVDFLAVSQYMQDTHGVRGDASDDETDATQGSMSFRGPGYSADMFFDVDTGTYDLTVDQQGLLAVMNDLHKGRNTGGAWNWTIDVAGGLLVAVAVSGLGLQFFTNVAEHGPTSWPASAPYSASSSSSSPSIDPNALDHLPQHERKRNDAHRRP